MNVMIVRALHIPHWQPHRLPVQHFKSLWISFTTLNHSVRSFIYVHFRQSSNVMELLQQTFIASENWHFAEKENYFRYQGHQYANRRICFFQYTVVLADNLLLLFLWAEPFLPNNIFILFLPFRNSIVSILRCYVLLTTALRFFLSLSHHETGISLPIFFLLNVPCISHVFCINAYTKTRNNFAFDFDFVTWSGWSAAYSTDSTNILSRISTKKVVYLPSPSTIQQRRKWYWQLATNNNISLGFFSISEWMVELLFLFYGSGNGIE